MQESGLRIGELARRSGVATATLRVWEARYGVLRPARTPGGHRVYTGEDLGRVQQVRHLVGEGWSVAAAAHKVSEDTGLARQPGAVISSPALASVDGGEALAGASPSQSGTTATATRRLADTLSAIGHDDDPLVAELTCVALRSMLRASSVHGVIDTLIGVVQTVGGSVSVARDIPDNALPVDLSFGQGEPILPIAEPLSIERMRLERILPGLIEDARRVVQLLRRAEG